MKEYLRVINTLIRLEPNLRIIKVLEDGLVVQDYENGETVRFRHINDELIIDDDDTDNGE